jgi:C4-dicarboxylate transporter DctQ subunit
VPPSRGGLLWSVEPTWSKFFILRLKKTATLNACSGDWMRMRDIYSIYILFLVAVALRYAGARQRAFAGADIDQPGHGPRRRK